MGLRGFGGAVVEELLADLIQFQLLFRGQPLLAFGQAQCIAMVDQVEIFLVKLQGGEHAGGLAIRT